MSKIIDLARRQYQRLPSAVRAGWVTAWVTFVGTLFTLATSLLALLAEALTERNFDAFLSSLALSAQAALAAALAFIAGCVNALYRWLRPIGAAYRDDG